MGWGGGGHKPQIRNLCSEPSSFLAESRGRELPYKLSKRSSLGIFLCKKEQKMNTRKLSPSQPAASAHLHSAGARPGVRVWGHGQGENPGGKLCPPRAPCSSPGLVGLQRSEACPPQVTGPPSWRVYTRALQTIKCLAPSSWEVSGLDRTGSGPGWRPLTSALTDPGLNPSSAVARRCDYQPADSLASLNDAK